MRSKKDPLLRGLTGGAGNVYLLTFSTRICVLVLVKAHSLIDS